MDIKININPETARVIACDLNSDKITLLPDTEAFLRSVLNTVNKKCISLKYELEEFNEINLINTNNGGK